MEYTCQLGEEGQGPSVGRRAVQSLCTARAELSSAAPPGARGLGGGSSESEGWRVENGGWNVEDGGWRMES